MIPSLFFTASIAHAMDLSSVLRGHGIRVYPLSGKTPDIERAKLIRLMREGAIDGLASCDVISTGFDCPTAMCACMARSTKSGLWYRQAIGRVLRPYPAPQGKREYQSEALRAIARSVKRGVVNQLLVLPTGTGKTTVSAKIPAVMKWWKGDKVRGRTLFLVHREELVMQTADTFRLHNPDIRIGVEKADQYATPDSELVIASVQTLGAEKDTRRKPFNPWNFDAVVTDECHFGSSSSLYAKIYEHFHVLKGSPQRDPEILHLGMTATPARADGIGLEKHYDEIVYVYDIRKAIQDGWLARIVAHRCETRVDISEVGVRADDFSAEALARTINTPERNELIAQKYLEVCEAEGMSVQDWTRPLGWIKPHAIVIDFADLSARHSLVSAATLFGLRAKFDPHGKDLVEQVEQIEKIEQEHPTLNLRDAPDMAAIRATLQSVDLLAAPNVPPEIGRHSKFGWLADGPGAYHLGLMDHKVLTVRENTLGQWEVYEHSRGVVNHLWTAKTLKESLALAEKQIPARDAPVLRIGAKWQGDPPSQKQANCIWQIDPRVRKHYPNADQFYNFCKTQYQSGNESYSKGGLSRTLTALDKA
jgi:superfamily II DNA or RNA helicase